MNLQRLIELEQLEQGLRVDMSDYFQDGGPKEAIQHPCNTACCHGGWALILAHLKGVNPIPNFGELKELMGVGQSAGYFLGLSTSLTTWLFEGGSWLVSEDDWCSWCSEREGRLRLRILIELQSEDVELLTAELKRRMAESVEAPVIEEIPVEVCV